MLDIWKKWIQIRENKVTHKMQKVIFFFAKDPLLNFGKQSFVKVTILENNICKTIL